MSWIDCVIEDCPNCLVDDPNPNCSKCHGTGMVFKPNKELKKMARQREKEER